MVWGRVLAGDEAGDHGGFVGIAGYFEGPAGEVELAQGQGPFSQPAPNFGVRLPEAAEQVSVSRFQAVGLERLQAFRDRAFPEEFQGIFPNKSPKTKAAGKPLNLVPDILAPSQGKRITSSKYNPTMKKTTATR